MHHKIQFHISFCSNARAKSSSLFLICWHFRPCNSFSYFKLTLYKCLKRMSVIAHWTPGRVYVLSVQFIPNRSTHSVVIKLVEYHLFFRVNQTIARNSSNNCALLDLSIQLITIHTRTIWKIKATTTTTFSIWNVNMQIAMQFSEWTKYEVMALQLL